MLLLAVDVANVLAIVIGMCGLSGCIFTAMRFNRDDTTAIVQQQSTIVHDFEALNTELRTRLEECESRAPTR